MGEVIAVVSGKGGTGKTSVCAAIATAMAESKETVLCIDCDIGLRNLDISLGISRLEALSFLDICRGGYTLSQATVHPDYPDLRFLTAPVSCRAHEISEKNLAQLLRQARKEFDFIFLDAPAGIDAGFRLAAKYADRVLLVTGADPASVRDAARAGDMLELMGKPEIRLIVNRVNPKMISAMDLTVDDVMDRAGLPLIGIVPDDPQVVLRASMDKPLLMRNKKGAAAACRRIAARLKGIRVPVAL